MNDKILSSLFLDTTLWADVLSHGVSKGISQYTLRYIQDPHGRADLCAKVAHGEYEIAPPHTGYRPKDDGGERTFFANEPLDRLLLNAIYKWLNKHEPSMIHTSCRSYQEGIGIGRIVKELSDNIVSLGGNNRNRVVGRKFDIHKYFDTVGLQYIHNAFDTVEQHHGKSKVIDLLRKYYNSNIYYDSRRRMMVEYYQGIKQGCAVSAWLANVLLYELDELLSKRNGCYVRYSDDIIYIGDDYEEVTTIIQKYLASVGLNLNEKKIEDVKSDTFVRFLGFDIRGSEITLSKKWVKSFQKRIDALTIKNRRLIRTIRNTRKKGGKDMEKSLVNILLTAQRNVSRFLYYGDGKHSWASLVLNTINSEEDMATLNLYCIDALKAVYTGHTSIGGLGKSNSSNIMRGKGSNVTSNRVATSHLFNTEADCLTSYYSIPAMKRIISNKWLYRTVVASLTDNTKYQIYPSNDTLHDRDSMTSGLEARYQAFLNSNPDGKGTERFYAYSLEDLHLIDLITWGNRGIAREELDTYIRENVNFDILAPEPTSWYWQSQRYPQLILLRDWFES